MSLITRCPACGTMFKVVSDQLKVSQGWVRCGQCAEVFDASLHLQTERPPQPVLADSQELPVAIADLPAETVATDLSQQIVGSSTPEAADSSYVEVVGAALNTTDDPLAAIPLADVPEEMPAEVSFVRDARRQAFWRRPLIRVLLVLFALLMVVLLALQLAVQQRDRLAVLEPKLKPALQMICEVLACNVGPVRQIEAIVIDSSSFNKISDSIYHLSFSIKNTVAAEMAMPSLEVTLTNTQDQAVVRRVLAPAQFGMTSGLLGASSEFSGALTLQLTSLEASRDTGNASRRIAGYRLLAFYP